MENNIKNMPTFEKRKLVKSGASFVVSIPRKWLDEQGLTEGGEIILKANGDLKIVVANKENIDEMNRQIENIRNQLSNSAQSVATGSQSIKAAAESG
tara:strand:+ start:310 stop:600 length:291 start_codon:yes stop_codon:yes gene_type:complete